MITNIVDERDRNSHIIIRNVGRLSDFGLPFGKKPGQGACKSEGLAVSSTHPGFAEHPSISQMQNTCNIFLIKIQLLINRPQQKHERR